MGNPRILALDDDPMFLHHLGDLLTAAGMRFLGLREATRAVPSAASFNPDLMLVDRHMPILTGTEVIRALRAFPETAHVPVAIATADHSEREVLRAFAAGAVDVLHKPLGPKAVQRIALLVRELAEMKLSVSVGGPSLLVQRLLGFCRRSERSGRLRVNPETPFEGDAQFHAGELVSASLGGLTGLAALEEMVTFETSSWVFEPESEMNTAPLRPLPDTPGPDDGQHVLVVDDDPDIRQLFQVQLRRAAFHVDLAEDGEEGFQLALRRPYDLILADLNMPELDGWGMLRRLRADHRTRDVPVIFLSAHDDYRETLRAARAGALDYLAKTGKAETVVERLRAALKPRVLALEALRSGSGSFRLEVVGPQWTLRQLGRLGQTGRLKCKDGWGTYTVAFLEGAPVGAKTVTSEREVTGLAAVAALLVSHDATGTFEPGTVSKTAPLAPTVEGLLERTGLTLNQLEARITDGKLDGATEFDVDEDLYELFRRVGSDRDLMLARALCEDRVAPKDLSARLALDDVEIREGLKELLRRRVISFRGDA